MHTTFLKYFCKSAFKFYEMDTGHYEGFFPDARLAKRGGLLVTNYLKAAAVY